MKKSLLSRNTWYNQELFYEYVELMKRIYNAIFTRVCKVSIQRKYKPGRNCTWISDLSVDNQKQLSLHIG